MSESPELSRLLQAFEERHINLGADDVAWAFKSPPTREALESWVREHVTELSLLASEEKAFTEKQNIATIRDASIWHYISDQSFEDAISSLEASTAAIEKECRLLDTQRQAFEKLKQRTPGTDATAGSGDQRDAKFNRERSHLEYKSSELADTLQSSLRSIAKEPPPPSNRGQPDAERILERDDRLLDGLEKILMHLADDDGDGGNATDATRLCQALKHFTSADIRAKMDAAYLNGMQQYVKYGNGVNGKASKESQQLASLNAELDELCREIDGLSTMAADTQYRNPIVQSLSTAKSESEADKASWADYIYRAIQYSTARVDYVSEQSDEQRAHGNAMKHISNALEEVLAAGAEGQNDKQGTLQSPTKAAPKGLKPLRLVQANFSDAQDPTSQLLRQLDVRISGEINGAALSAASSQKAENLATLRANTERSISDQLAQSLAEADKDVQQLLAATLMHSPYSTVYVESSTVRDSIDGLESKTQDLSGKMRDLDIEAITGTAREKQQELMDRLSER